MKAAAADDALAQVWLGGQAQPANSKDTNQVEGQVVAATDAAPMFPRYQSAVPQRSVPDRRIRLAPRATMVGRCEQQLAGLPA
jgi:hypothetical protein